MRYQVLSETPISIAALADGTHQIRRILRAPMAAEGLRRFLSSGLSKSPWMDWDGVASVFSENAVFGADISDVRDSSFPRGAAPEFMGAAREESDLRVTKAEGFRNNLRRWRRWPTFNLA